MLALIIALLLIAAVLGHLVKDQNSARRDREFYESVMAARQHTSVRDAIAEVRGNRQLVVPLSRDPPATEAPR
jgi:hypothetical protein